MSRLTQEERDVLGAALEFYLAGEWDFEQRQETAERASYRLTNSEPLTPAQREITITCGYGVLRDEWPDGWDEYKPETLEAALAILEGRSRR